MQVKNHSAWINLTKQEIKDSKILLTCAARVRDSSECQDSHLYFPFTLELFSPDFTNLGFQGSFSENLWKLPGFSLPELDPYHHICSIAPGSRPPLGNPSPWCSYDARRWAASKLRTWKQCRVARWFHHGELPSTWNKTELNITGHQWISRAKQHQKHPWYQRDLGTPPFPCITGNESQPYRY